MPAATRREARNKERQPKLHLGMTVEAFDGGYFYATELKMFARKIGISVGNFRKNELEDLIREHLKTSYARIWVTGG